MVAGLKRITNTKGNLRVLDMKLEVKLPTQLFIENISIRCSERDVVFSKFPQGYKQRIVMFPWGIVVVV